MELALMDATNKVSLSGVLSIIDTEAKQLQAIEDLYRIVVAQPKYAKLASKQWNEKTPPVQVLLWLLRKLGALAGGKDWTIDTYRHGRKTRYQFVAYQNYSSYNVKGHGEMALDFLPYLIKRDKPLHDLIIDTVALVSKANKVPLWDDDGFYSEAIKAVKADPFLKNEMFAHRVKTYQNGPATQYLRLLKKRRRIVTPESLSEQIKAYQANSDRKKYLLYYMKRAVSVAAGKECIASYTYVPGYEKKEVLTPLQAYGFAWSHQNKDPVLAYARKQVQKLVRHGSYDPVMFSVCRPGEVYTPVQKSTFPEDLETVLRGMANHFSGTYSNYYYKQLERELESGQASTLLESFVLADVLNLDTELL